MGTATYFSPEQAQGLGVDGRSDVYALGVVLYEMVTGRPPFMADTPVAIAYKHVSEAPPLPSEIEPRVPRDLEAIIMQAMAKQPQDRYVTAQDFNDDLERFMRDQPVLARSVHGASPGEPTIAIPASTTMIMSAPGGAAAATTVQKAVSAPKPASSKPDLPKRRFVPWLIAAVLLAAALVAIVYFGGRSLGYFGGATSFHPQDVVAKPYKSAEAILSRQGLKSAVKFEEGTAASKGLVERQSPEASSLVKKGDNVTLYVDAGPKKALLDYVVGQTLAQARKDLQAAHFNVRVAYKAPTSSTIAAGTVLNQNPKSGGYYPVGSTVTLTVAKGTANVTIPSKGVVGESLADARGVLRVAGFNVEVENYQFSSTYADGDVITTSPSPGSSEPQGSTVYLVVSKGPSSTVPNVLSPLMTQAQAIAAINSAGLTYKVIYVTTAGYEAGYVTSQSPSAGTPVTPNSVVTIYVEETAPTTTTSTTTSTTTTTTTAP
jgi:serine/threonine-protein kinase